MTADSPLRAWGVVENDTVLGVGSVDVYSPEELARALYQSKANGGDTVIRIYRHELLLSVRPSAGWAIPSTDAAHLGVTAWSRGRDTRGAGFYGHYTTFAEVVQLIASLAFALAIVAPGAILGRMRLLLAAAVGLLGLGLFLSVTRASWAGFAISAAIIFVCSLGRKWFLIGLAAAVPLALAGAIYMQQTRNITLIDTEYGGSTSWRLIVWQEAWGVLTSSPKHLAVGVGLDSIKKRHAEWGMFAQGNLPLGHLHSTPLQIAFERGLPTLIAWIIWMFIYLKLLWQNWREPRLEWPERGLLLGAFGGTIGFLASGLVHYNWGDSEVVMVFYIVMGMSLSVIRGQSEPPREAAVAA